MSIFSATNEKAFDDEDRHSVYLNPLPPSARSAKSAARSKSDSPPLSTTGIGRREPSNEDSDVAFYSPDGSLLKRVDKLTPIYDGVPPIALPPPVCPQPIPCLHPVFQLRNFFLFDFAVLPGEVTILNSKTLLQDQITQAAFVSALLSTMILPMLIVVSGDATQAGGFDGEWITEPDASLGQVAGPTTGWYFKAVVATLLSSSLVLCVSCVVHSVFYLIMMNSFVSLDEVTCWLDEIGWKATSPLRMFVLGTLMFIAAAIIYLCKIFELRISVLALAIAWLVCFCFPHYVLASVTASFYRARYKVSRGWRIADKVTVVEDPSPTSYELYLKPFFDLYLSCK